MTIAIPNVVGIHLQTHIDEGAGEQRCPESSGERTISAGWMTATISTRLADELAQHKEPGGLEVLLDGTLSDVVGLPYGRAFPISAAGVSELYRAHGRRLLLALRGSYVCLIVDHRKKQALLFNDRQASRPLYVQSSHNHAFRVAPSIAALGQVSRAPLDPEAVCELALSRSFFDKRTLFLGVTRFPMGCCLTLTPTSTNFEAYWDAKQLEVSAVSDKEQLVEDLNERILTATRRILRVARNPVLFLSGGIDSRLVLGALQKVGARPVPVAVYGDGSSPKSDVAIARTISNALHLPRHEFPLEITAQSFVDYALPSTILFDCCAETIDCAPLMRIFAQLAMRFDTFINGDEKIGNKVPVFSYQEALESAHFCSIDAVPWLKYSWFKRAVVNDIRKTRRLMVRTWLNELPHDTPDRFRDAFYQLNRGGGNYNNALTAGKLRYFEPARPLLDEDVAELHLRLPQDVLTQKWIFHCLIEQHYPELSKFPYATERSIPVAEAFRNLLNQSEMFVNFVRCNLVETMDPRLEDLLNKAALSRFIETMRREGSIAVAYYRWFHRLPGGWRMMKTPSTPQLNPIMVMLRLLQINLFLKEISKAG